MATGKSASVSFSVILACVSLAMVSACGKDDGDGNGTKAPPVGAFLKESDFSATKLREVSESDLKGSGDSSVSALSELKRSVDSSESNAKNDSSDKAQEECLYGGVTYTVTNKSTVTVSATIDATACAQKAITKEAPDVKITITKAKFRLFAQLTCDGADFSVVNGKKVTDFGEIGKIGEEHCGKAIRRAVITNLETEGESSYTIEGKEMKQGSLQQLATMNADGTPCILTQADNVSTWSDGCGFYDKSLTTSAETPALVGTALLKVVKFTGVKEVNDKTSPYFSEGKASIDINGWKGEAVFAGATQAPSWSLKKGDVTVTGVYAPSAEKKD
jgi:hypothetical protein